jgi:hypothetical protein
MTLSRDSPAVSIRRYVCHRPKPSPTARNFTQLVNVGLIKTQTKKMPTLNNPLPFKEFKKLVKHVTSHENTSFIFTSSLSAACKNPYPI